MEEQFVPYELAVKLKELRFDKECIAWYLTDMPIGTIHSPILSSYLSNWSSYGDRINAPLWQQAFDWFRNNGYYVNYQSEENFTCFKRVTPNMEILSFVRKYDVENHYEQARQACLEKLIEIWKKK